MIKASNRSPGMDNDDDGNLAHDIADQVLVLADFCPHLDLVNTNDWIRGVGGAAEPHKSRGHKDCRVNPRKSNSKFSCPVRQRPRRSIANPSG